MCVGGVIPTTIKSQYVDKNPSEQDDKMHGHMDKCENFQRFELHNNAFANRVYELFLNLLAEEL